jgi:hypothetical protein
LIKPYWFDACSFTQIQRVYPRENFEPVWLLIEQLISSGQLKSIEDVYLELAAQDDFLAAWAENRKQCFYPLEEAIQREARNILARFPTLISLKNNKPSSSADPFLIACAIVHGGTVVTQEDQSGGPPTVKIPDVCNTLDIKCVKLLRVLQNEGFRSSPPQQAPSLNIPLAPGSA